MTNRLFLLVFSFITLLSVGAPRSANREPGVPYIQNYGEKDYNANPQNWSVVQNKRGVMFFGNTAGILEYDGVHWRLMNPAIVRSLAVDSSGVVYVGSLSDLGIRALFGSGNVGPGRSGALAFPQTGTGKSPAGGHCGRTYPGTAGKVRGDSKKE